jgi:hypothetical protein
MNSLPNHIKNVILKDNNITIEDISNNLYDKETFEEKFDILFNEIIIGMFYGYPKCCIIYFIKYFIIGKSTYIKRLDKCILACSNTGFIPCYKHAIEISNNNINIANLIIKEERKVSTNFPINIFDEDDQMKFISSYDNHNIKIQNIIFRYFYNYIKDEED